MLGKPLTVTAPGRRAWLGWAGPLCSNCLLRLIAACKEETVTSASTERVNKGSLHVSPWRTAGGLHPPSHKNIEARFQFSLITATLAASECRRPTFSMLISGVFMMERVSGNLPRPVLRLCISALEDNYSLRVSGGMHMLVSQCSCFIAYFLFPSVQKLQLLCCFTTR